MYGFLKEKQRDVWHGLSLPDIAQLIRDELDKNYTGCDFTVRCGRSGYREISVQWVNGPRVGKVRQLISKYSANSQFWLFRNGTVIPATDQNISKDLYPEYEKKAIKTFYYIDISYKRSYSKDMVPRLADEFFESTGIKVDLRYLEKIKASEIGIRTLSLAFRFYSPSEDIYYQSYWQCPNTYSHEEKREINEMYRNYVDEWGKFIGQYSILPERPVIDYFVPVPDRG